MAIVNQTSMGLAGLDVLNPTSDQKFALGTRVKSILGSGKDKASELVYIKAEGVALTVGLVYELPLIAGTDAYKVDTVITTTSANTIANAAESSFAVCVPAATFASGEFGWAYVRGTFPIFVGTLAVYGAKLYTTATSGLVDDVATACELIGTWALATVGGANAVVDCHSPADLRIIKNS